MKTKKSSRKEGNEMNWIKRENHYMVPIKSWCESPEQKALEQAENLACHPAVFNHVALMPDCHPGYGMPIGGVIACIKAVIPNAVGVDIGCGMGAVKSNILLTEETTRNKLRELVNNIKTRVPCGEGKCHKTPQEWEGFDDKLDALSDRQWMDKHTKKLAKKNLGTLGGGNHFIEIQVDTNKLIWLMIHSGSRNMGNVIAKYYHKLAVEINAKWQSNIPTTDLAFLSTDSDEGNLYIQDMNFALDYARENRKRILINVMDAFQNMYPQAVFEAPINIHHNYAAIENHFGKNVWIHRKGATSARKDEMGIIPGSMGTPSFIVKGLGNPESFMSCSHGAGRVFGRNEASAKLTPEECDQAMGQIVYDRWHKVRRGKVKGLYDLGEAPQAYKNIHSVIEAQKDLVTPVIELKPLAVVKG